MMKLTRNLKVYTAFIILVSTIFYVMTMLDVGTNTTENSDGTTTITSSIPLYWFATVFIAFLLFYFTDKKRDSRSNLGLAYHIVTTAVVLLPLAIFSIYSIISKGMLDYFVLVPMGALIISLLIHWIATRRDLKGFESKKVFK